jgi:glycine cleavage system H protein
MIRLFRNIPKVLPVRNTSIRNFSNTNIPKKMVYTENEEWHYHENDYIKVGVTKKAIQELSEIVYVDFNFDKNDNIELGDDILTIESVKATECINIDFNCVLIENNEHLVENLELLNDDPENIKTSYLVKIKKID